MWSAAWLLLGAITSVAAQETGNHPDWPRWCGKVYKPEYPSFDPGGQTLPPTPDPQAPLLHVQFEPRYSLYLESEKTGEFIVNAEISQFHGSPWSNNTASNVSFHITTTEDNKLLVEDSVAVNSTSNLYTFNLTSLTPSLSPIEVTLAYSDGSSINSTLLYLPSKSSGSTTRIDKLTGGLFHLVNSSPKSTFKPIFPYGFYASYDNFLALPNSSALIQSYASLGLTGMIPLSHYPESSAAFQYMSTLPNFYYMFDLRENYTNRTWVSSQVSSASVETSLIGYWSVDEPDGWQAPFSAPLETYSTIRKTDPYHPVAVVLNCQNYYFEEYSAGADIIMADVYPIGTRESSANLTKSKWGTPCNETYGDCGCDNCFSGNEVLDVPKRFEDLARYERWLGQWPKSKMFNPQAFHGEGYWARDPTEEESWTMVLLAVNSGVKGVFGWVWPTSEVLGRAHGRLAKVVGGDEEVVGLLVEGRGPTVIKVEGKEEGVDVAGWVGKDGRKMLVNVVNTGEEAVEGMVELEIPEGSKVEKVVWNESGGNGEWAVKDGKLTKDGLKGMGTALVVLELSE
ncbi:hypothetical protein B0T20DRAFT_362325 [Sordaria brevicollis]|uniref:Uncharacterized protein n=1 Tax=Sordaria brevicollis TaxID=83679 RepID=A0AAE0P2B7_SORBR|nr:hypothetical protein B0T20DRAFT_362325 [Sordaria brevicollis]